MTIRAAVLAALAAALPVAASAQVEEGPRWTLGAGIGDGATVQLPTPSRGSSGARLSDSLFGDGVPVATFFVERRVKDGTWLVLGAAAGLSRDRFYPSPDTGATVLTKSDSERFSLSAGLRRVVTRPGAPVGVSVQGTVEGGYLQFRRETTTTGAADPTSEIRDAGGFLRLTGGIAVERVLTGDLALRISTPLVGVSWARVVRKDDAGSRDGSSANLFVTLAPQIELRLAF